MLYTLDSNRVRDRIETLDLKRWWVAEFAGIHPTTLRRWLSGGIQRVRESNLQRLADLLETPAKELVRGGGVRDLPKVNASAAVS